MKGKVTNPRRSSIPSRKDDLGECIRVSLESWLSEARKSNPDILSAAVVDDVGALLAFTGEVFVSTRGEELDLGTILMFINGMAEAGSKFLGSGQVQSVLVNCEGGKWFVIKLGGGEARSLLGIKTTVEANLAAVMLDTRNEAEKITALMTETKPDRESYFEAPKRLSKLTAEDMAAWWGFRFKTLRSKKKAEQGQEKKAGEYVSIKEYWNEALKRVKKED